MRMGKEVWVQHKGMNLQERRVQYGKNIVEIWLRAHLPPGYRPHQTCAETKIGNTTHTHLIDKDIDVDILLPHGDSRRPCIWDTCQRAKKEKL